MPRPPLTPLSPLRASRRSAPTRSSRPARASGRSFPPRARWARRPGSRKRRACSGRPKGPMPESASRAPARRCARTRRGAGTSMPPPRTTAI
ncbi:hypothetical protein LTR60_001640, partial [Cryomyces antarcticus]